MVNPLFDETDTGDDEGDDDNDDCDERYTFFLQLSVDELGVYKNVKLGLPSRRFPDLPPLRRCPLFVLLRLPED